MHGRLYSTGMDVRSTKAMVQRDNWRVQRISSALAILRTVPGYLTNFGQFVLKTHFRVVTSVSDHSGMPRLPAINF
jgi:hypothetical protein